MWIVQYVDFLLAWNDSQDHQYEQIHHKNTESSNAHHLTFRLHCDE